MFVDVAKIRITAGKGGDARKIFEREALACDLYNLALPCWKDIRWGDDWRKDAIYVK